MFHVESYRMHIFLIFFLIKSEGDSEYGSKGDSEYVSKCDSEYYPNEKLNKNIILTFQI